MVRRKDRKRNPERRSLRPRGAGVYTFVGGEQVRGGDDDIAETSKQTLPGTGPGKKSRAKAKSTNDTLPGTGPARARPKASRKETLIGTGTGKATAAPDGEPAHVTMPRSSEAPAPSGPLPWSADTEDRVEVEIAPTPAPGEAGASEPPAEQVPARDDDLENATTSKSPAEAKRPRDRAAPRGRKPRRKLNAPTIALAVVATAAVLYVIIRPDSSRSDGESAIPPAGTETLAPAAVPAGKAPGKTAAAATAGTPSAAAGEETTAPTAEAATSDEEGADGSDLPPHEGYLEVRGASAELYVYGRGKRLGKTADRMRMRCGAVTVRLGDRAPKHWYSEPERIRVACQEVTTVKVEPIDPVSILEDGVPAEAATAEATVAPVAPRPPPAPRPQPTNSGPNWVPPSI